MNENNIDTKTIQFKINVNYKKNIFSELIVCKLIGSKENFIQECPKAKMLINKFNSSVISSYLSKENIALNFNIDLSKVKLKPRESKTSVINKYNEICDSCKYMIKQQNGNHK